MSEVRLILGDCREMLPTLEAASCDSLVCDPPAGISFMGLEFDTFHVRDMANEPSRGKRKTGGGNKTVDTGFAKGITGLNYSQRGRAAFITFLSSVMSEALRVLKPGAFGLVWALPRTSHWTATALEDAGFEIRDRIAHLFGTGFPKAKSCLKPACEDWWLVRKPGKMQPLQIDECRIGVDELSYRSRGAKGLVDQHFKHGDRPYAAGLPNREELEKTVTGRWPANLLLSHHPECNGECHPECAVQMLDEQSGESKGKASGYDFNPSNNNNPAHFVNNIKSGVHYGDTGGASRFFYVAKASRRDRGEGNTHPTVKSTSLMSWLVKLVTPPGGLCLDPFAGSGSTLLACQQTGRSVIGIEMSPEYHAIAQKRIAEAQAACPLFPS